MKISYKWLKDYVEIDKSPQELAELLTEHCFEVENVINLGAGLDQVVVGEVVFKEKHPDADRLSVTQVKVGETETLDIVCGAPNVAVGQKVAVAKIGASLPSGMKIEERKVRGKLSRGMICAEDELGLGQSHEGIMVLDASLAVGTPVKEALNLDDTILDIDVLPNRAHDCLCHLGVAREVAALTGRKAKELATELTPEGKGKPGVEVEVREEELCRRYSAAEIKDVTVGESPAFVKARLESVELRPINNIVDITNYIMFAFGQPLHAFDADKLEGKIVVRRARAGEKILALDDQEYELQETDLVIADEEKPLAVAGVIGGKEASVTQSTKNVIFESANFFGAGIRKTAQRLKISTDSSHRFEREIDPAMTRACLEEAVRLAGEYAGGRQEEGIIDVYPAPRQEKTIEFAYGRIENLLGISIPEAEALGALNALGLRAVSETSRISVTVPTYRIDVEQVNDVIEEVARIYGYGKIPARLTEVAMAETHQGRMWELKREVREIWKGLGFSEVYNYSLIGEKEIARFRLERDKAVELKNFLSEDAKLFRSSMMPRLVGNVRENLKYQDEVRLFELGRVAWRQPRELPIEKEMLSGVLSSHGLADKLFFAGKGMVEASLNSLGIEGVRFEALGDDSSYWHPGRSASMILAGKTVGHLGEIHPRVLDELDLESRVFGFEIDLEELSALSGERSYAVVSKQPSSEFDLAVVVDQDLVWQRIADSLAKLGESVVKSVVPFDIYRGENIASGKKSIAFKVVLQAEDRTLSDDEIRSVRERMVGALAELGGEIRQ